MPITDTPPGVTTMLLILASALIGILWVFMGVFGIVVALVVMAYSTSTYCITTPQFHAGILINEFTKTQRVIFQGLNFKLPWETLQTHAGHPTFIDLRVELQETVKDTYTAMDALMEVTYVQTIRPNYSGFRNALGGMTISPEEAIITFASYKPDAITRDAKALNSRLLSDYYSRHNAKADLVNGQPGLLDKARILQEVKEESAIEIREFEEQHGIDLELSLEDSDFDAETQKFRDLLSKAESLSEARKKLVGAHFVGDIEKLLKLMAFPDNVQDFNLDVKGLENMTHLSWVGGLGGAKPKGPGKGKKGGGH